MVRRFARKAGRTLAIALSAAMLFTSAAEPLVVSANPAAADGAMTSKPASGKLAEKVSYVAFPKTTDGQTMEMDITVLERSDDSSKDKGLFVGVFEIGNGREYFTSLGFRHVSGLSGDDGKGGLTGYWIKDPVTKGAGNGGSKSNNGAASNDYNTKPAYELNKTWKSDRRPCIRFFYGKNEGFCGRV